jgi:hypothetical protein
VGADTAAALLIFIFVQAAGLARSAEGFTFLQVLDAGFLF